MNHQRTINGRRQRRRFHVRSKVRGTPDRPRMSVYRSNKNISVQVIDDEAGKTLVSASTRDANVRSDIAYGGNKDAASKLGKIIAERALAAGIQAVRFDRAHYKYHGRIAALADAAREAGLSL